MSSHSLTNSSTPSTGPTPSSDVRAVARVCRWVHFRCKGILGKHGRRKGGAAGPGDQVAGPGEGTEIFEAFNRSKGVVLASRVEWAGTSEARRRGLLGRDHIDSDEGAYIVPTQWIHMFGMRFPIDVVFLDSEGRILQLYHALNPNRLSRIVWGAEGALELAAGTLENTGTEVGDIIELR